jgi:hypothetical protein
MLVSDDDEPMDLEVYSDCCLAEYEEVPEGYIDDLVVSYLFEDKKIREDLSDLDRLILEAYEV